MTAFLDTSVLVAAFWGDHEDHDANLNLLGEMNPDVGACAAHTLAEVYSVMTRLPVKPPILPEQAMLFLEDIRSKLSIICMDETDYMNALSGSADRGISGGRIYDVLLLHCARKAGALTIYTLNVSHFRQIAPDLAERIKKPRDSV